MGNPWPCLSCLRAIQQGSYVSGQLSRLVVHHHGFDGWNYMGRNHRSWESPEALWCRENSGGHPAGPCHRPRSVMVPICFHGNRPPIITKPSTIKRPAMHQRLPMVVVLRNHDHPDMGCHPNVLRTHVENSLNGIPPFLNRVLRAMFKHKV